MVQLIQMRQQINAIESIKKITHAMRLISMSSHAQLNHKVPLIENYKNELIKIISIIESSDKNLKTNILKQENKHSKTLVILVGSQKGLAGSFNSALFHFFEEKSSKEDYKNIDFITIGKKATDFIKKYATPIVHYDNFNLLTLADISQKVFQFITSKKDYKKVIVYSNYKKSFFLQEPVEQIVVPIQSINTEHISQEVIQDYIWEQPMQEIYENLINKYLFFSIQSILFNSLLSEQAARFQSMDNATRNAEELLDTLKLQYNKMRQTKITKEITELSASLAQN